MIRRLRRLATFGLLPLGLTLLAPACVDNYGTLFIRQVQVPDPGDDCITQPDPAARFYPGGMIDRVWNGRGVYEADLLVGNQLVSRGSASDMRVETSRVTLYEVEVELFDYAGNVIGDAFTVPVSGFVDQASESTPGYGIARAVLIPSGHLAAIPAGAQGTTVVARIIVYGITTGGADVETGPWDFPIYVCDDCLRCTPESDEEDIESCGQGLNWEKWPC